MLTSPPSTAPYSRRRCRSASTGFAHPAGTLSAWSPRLFLRGQVEEILAVEGLQYVQLATPLVDEWCDSVRKEVEAARAGCDSAASHGGNVAGAADIAEGFVFDTVLALGTFFKACRHAGGVGPGGEQLIEQRLLPGACPGGLELGKQAGNIAGLGSGLLQFAHIACTAQARQDIEFCLYIILQNAHCDSLRN